MCSLLEERRHLLSCQFRNPSLPSHRNSPVLTPLPPRPSPRLDRSPCSATQWLQVLGQVSLCL